MLEVTTLCYLERDGKYLMLNRNKKKNDVNEGKWIGVGGHFEEGESPEDCLRREVMEETGLTLKSQKFRGIVTFIYNSADKNVTEYMHLFTSDDFEGELIKCDEGELEWIDIDKILDLPLWEGDKIFLKLLRDEDTFFNLKLVYEDDILVHQDLNMY